jgi:hypothetical protein
MVTPAARREAVAHLRSHHEISERRACRLIDCQRMTVRYRRRRLLPTWSSSLGNRAKALRSPQASRLGPLPRIRPSSSIARLKSQLEKIGGNVNSRPIFTVRWTGQRSSGLIVVRGHKEKQSVERLAK